MSFCVCEGAEGFAVVEDEEEEDGGDGENEAVRYLREDDYADRFEAGYGDGEAGEDHA